MNVYPPFAGFGATAIDWFHRLDAANSKAFFLATKREWEDVIRHPMESLIGEAAERFEGAPKFFRPYRDVRFSPDKRPIKANCYGVVQRGPGVGGGPGGGIGALYAALSKDGLYAGTGLYDMAKDQLARFRDAAAEPRRGEALADIVDALATAGIEVTGDRLATAPRGFPRDHPRIALLRLKYIVAGATLPPGPALADRRALDHAFGVWEAAQPLADWLTAHVGESEIAFEDRFARG